MDDSLHRGEPYPGAFKCLLRMQSLENTEKFIFVFHIKPHPVVLDEHYHFLRRVVQRIDFYLGLLAGSSKLNRVRNQVAEHEPQHRRIPVATRQMANAPVNLPLLSIGRDFADQRFNKLLEIDRCLLRFGAADP